MRALYFFIFLILSPLGSFPQENNIKNFISGISPEELKDHIIILASEKFEGRYTASAGEYLTAKYLAENFSNSGLLPVNIKDSSYFQEFTLHKEGWETFQIIHGQDTFSLGSEIYANGHWWQGRKNVEVIFVGFGCETDLYTDYSNISVEGKIAAFMKGEPSDKQGKYLTTNSFAPEYSQVGYDKTALAMSKGAIGAIMIDPDNENINNIIRINKRFSNSSLLYLPKSNSDEKFGNIIYMSEENASTVFNNKSSDWEKYRIRSGRNKALNDPLKSEFTIYCDKGARQLTSRNVGAVLKGSEFPDEYIIITAHYDHLGKRNDEIYFGADDNASGTAALLEIAEAFSEASRAGIKPKRSIVFLPVSGEEKGLLGSKYYTMNPIYPLENTKAAINMDMIGRQDDYSEKDTSYVFVYLSDNPGSLLDSSIQKAAELEGGGMETILRYEKESGYNNRGSDHASFSDAGVPVVYFYCGTHDDYHRPTDTWELIDYENLSRISRMVFLTAWELANK